VPTVSKPPRSLRARPLLRGGDEGHPPHSDPRVPLPLHGRCPGVRPARHPPRARLRAGAAARGSGEGGALAPRPGPRAAGLADDRGEHPRPLRGLRRGLSHRPLRQRPGHLQPHGAQDDRSHRRLRGLPRADRLAPVRDAERLPADGRHREHAGHPAGLPRHEHRRRRRQREPARPEARPPDDGHRQPPPRRAQPLPQHDQLVHGRERDLERFLGRDGAGLLRPSRPKAPHGPRRPPRQRPGVRRGAHRGQVLRRPRREGRPVRAGRRRALRLRTRRGRLARRPDPQPRAVDPRPAPEQALQGGRGPLRARGRLPVRRIALEREPREHDRPRPQRELRPRLGRLPLGRLDLPDSRPSSTTPAATTTGPTATGTASTPSSAPAASSSARPASSAPSPARTSSPPACA